MLVCTGVGKAQDTTSFYGKMNYVFYYVDKSQITSGILKEYGMDFLNLENYSGTALHDSNFVGLDEWRSLYGSLYSSQINGNAAMPYLDAINAQFAAYSNTSDPIAFTILHYNYNGLRDDALTANLLTVNNDHLYDVPGRSQSPYTSAELFAVAPLRQRMNPGQTEIVFRSDLIWGNTGKTISSISVDIANSGSWQAVTLNTPLDLNYLTEGFHDISIRVIYTDNTTRYGHTKLYLYPGENNAQNRFGPGRSRINTAFIADKAYLGGLAQGDITVQYALNNFSGTIRKPLIVVEGFDPNNEFGFSSFTRGLDINDNNGQFISLNNGLDNLNEYDLVFLNLGNTQDYIQRNAFLLEKVINFVNSVKSTWNGVRQDNVVMGLSMGGLVARYALRDMELNNEAHETRLFISHDTPHWGANVPVGAQLAVQDLASYTILNIGGSFPFFRMRDLFPEAVSAVDIFNSPAARQMLIQRYTISGNNLNAANADHTAFSNELNTMGWPLNCRNITLSNGACNGTKLFPDNSSIFQLSGNRSMSYLGNLWRSAAATAFSSVSWFVLPVANPVVLNIQLPLALFSTKTSLITDYRINAVPTYAGELYRGDIYTKRKILWAITVNTYIIKKRFNAPGGILPLDNAPGGVYSINQFGLDQNAINASLPAFLGASAQMYQSGFCFIPTVSSLAVTNPVQYLHSNLCDITNCITPAEVQASFVPTSNEEHISNTQPGTDWLLELQDPNYSCPKICTQNAISGPSAFCGNQTYSIGNLPAGSTVTWSTTGNVSIVGPATSNSVELVNNSEWTLSGSVIATVHSPCGNATFTKALSSGYWIEIFDVPSGPYCAGQSWMAYASSSMDDYYWEVAGGTIISGQGTPYLSFQIDQAYWPDPYYSNTFGLYLVVKDGCGKKVAKGISRPVIYCDPGTGGGVSWLTAYPNPASSQVNVAFKDSGPATSGLRKQPGTPAVYDVKLLDHTGKVLRAKMRVSGDKASLDTSGLPDGTYFLHVTRGNETAKMQVIVKH
jgi:hypothetical protein